MFAYLGGTPVLRTRPVACLAGCCPSDYWSHRYSTRSATRWSRRLASCTERTETQPRLWPTNPRHGCMPKTPSALPVRQLMMNVHSIRTHYCSRQQNQVSDFSCQKLKAHNCRSEHVGDTALDFK